MKFLVLFCLIVGQLLMGCGSSQKKEAMDAPLPTSQTLDSESLILNGSGYRIASKFGFTAKVYKAGLYLKSKTTDDAALRDSHEPKWIHMRFVFKATKHQVADGWTKGYEHTCRPDCSSTKGDFLKFKDMLTGMNIGQEMDLIFMKDQLQVRLDGKEVGRIESAKFSEIIFNVFMGPDVLDKKLKDQLLGR